MENSQIEYNHEINSYVITIFGKNFTVENIDTSKMDNVIIATKELSSSLLEIIGYYNESATITLKILDGVNDNMELLAIENNEVTYNFFE